MPLITLAPYKLNQTGHAVDGNTLALWRHDEASGAVVADATGVYALSSPNRGIVAGQIGNARDFPGNSNVNDITQYDNGAVDAAFVLACQGNMTVEALIKPFNGLGDGTKGVFYLDSGTDVGTKRIFSAEIANGAGGTLSLQAFSDSSGFTDTTTFASGAFMHAAWVLNGTTLQAYVNGVATTSATFNRPAYVGAGRVVLGDRWGFFARFGGLIDEVRISNKARSLSEIQASYAACFG